MPVEIQELIVRARVQQSGTESDAQPGQSPRPAQTPAGSQGGQTADHLRPTVEEIIHDILLRKNER